MNIAPICLAFSLEEDFHYEMGMLFIIFTYIYVYFAMEFLNKRNPRLFNEINIFSKYRILYLKRTRVGKTHHHRAFRSRK